MNDLVTRARRIVRNYPEHVARREQALLITELANYIERQDSEREALLVWLESQRESIMLLAAPQDFNNANGRRQMAHEVMKQVLGMNRDKETPC